MMETKTKMEIDVEMDAPAYFAIIPADVRFDNRLTADEKLLFGEITAFSSKDGRSTVPNKKLAELYNVTEDTISNWIGNLERYGYIEEIADHTEESYFSIN